MENELKIHHQPTILASSKIPSRILGPCVQSPLPVNYAAVDTLDIALRLGAATLVGAVLGLNRDLHGKPTGVRTLGLVCLGSALAVLSIHEGNSTDASRIIRRVADRCAWSLSRSQHSGFWRALRESNRPALAGPGTSRPQAEDAQHDAGA